VADDPTATPAALLPAGYRLRPSPPTADAVCRLRRSVGTSERSVEVAERGLSNTLFDVHVVETDAETAVGMARVVGDGARTPTSSIPRSPSHTRAGGSAPRWSAQWDFERTAPVFRAMGVRSESLRPTPPPDG